MYDVERFGIINTGNPKHADIFLVTGSVNEQNIKVVQQIYEQMPGKGCCRIGIVPLMSSRNAITSWAASTRSFLLMYMYLDVQQDQEAIIDGVVKGLGVLAETSAMDKKPAIAAEKEEA